MINNKLKTRPKTLNNPAIYTDFYELTMAQGYFLSGREKENATFDYFFRELPFDGGYVVFAGLADLLEIMIDFTFRDEELDYLEDQGFHQEFLDYLKSFSLNVTVHSVREGEIVFPLEPVIRVEGSIIETQLLETLILNLLNFESLIATKARRLRYSAGNRKVLDFGLRRAQGLGGIHASKAAVIGGVDGTSNVYSSFAYDIPASGTMAHSWVQSFEDELTSFRKFAEYYPDNSVLLVDTYDTLASGVPNAIKVAKELEERGYQLKGIRLDSGDLAYFSRKARQQLDEADLEYVKIAASNQLDERLIHSLISQNAPIDIFGVGTRLVTGHESPALDGVYKLSGVNDQPTLKISENVEKVTLPGKKKVVRYFDDNGMFYGDGIVLTDDRDVEKIYHPYYSPKHSTVGKYDSELLHTTVMENGKVTITPPTAKESAEYCNERFKRLNPEHKRFDNPHIYKVGVSKRLMNLRDELTQSIKDKNR